MFSIAFRELRNVIIEDYITLLRLYSDQICLTATWSLCPSIAIDNITRITLNCGVAAINREYGAGDV